MGNIRPDAESIMQHLEWDLNDSTVMDNKKQWAERSEVAQWFAGKHVLVTGGTGFMGLALIEKLLRSCPNIARIYVIVRERKGKTITERVEEMLNEPLFDRVKREQGKSFCDSVVPINGDVGSVNLGLSEEDASFLASKVNIIFHLAANVKFNANLTAIGKVNVRGTKYLIELARRCINLNVLVHVSTGFCNRGLEHIEEKLYDPVMDPDKFLTMIEGYKEEDLNIVSHKFIDKYNNAYMVTKQIAEDLIKNCGLPSCVFRPVIITSSHEEPFPGWTSIVSAPIALNLGIVLGIIHALPFDSNVTPTAVPLDLSVNAMILSGWDTSQRWLQGQSTTPIVYNNGPTVPLPEQNSITQRIIRIARETPSKKNIWWSEAYFIKNIHLWRIFDFFVHLLPAMLIDTILLCRGKKPQLLKIYAGIHRHLHTVYKFEKGVTFANDNLTNLSMRLSQADKLTFPTDTSVVDWDQYCVYVTKGIRTFLLKESDDTLPEAKRKMRKFRIGHYLIKFIVFSIGVIVLWNIVNRRIISRFY